MVPFRYVLFLLGGWSMIVNSWVSTFLFKEGLEQATTSTLKVYVAAIAAWHCGWSLGKYRLDVRFLSGACRLKPPRPHLNPSWELCLVLQALQRDLFERPGSCEDHNMRWKSALFHPRVVTRVWWTQDQYTPQHPLAANLVEEFPYRPITCGMPLFKRALVIWLVLHMEWFPNSDLIWWIFLMFGFPIGFTITLCLPLSLWEVVSPSSGRALQTDSSLCSSPQKASPFNFPLQVGCCLHSVPFSAE